MTHCKVYMSFVLIVFLAFTVLGQDKLAIISDPDGYTNIRSGQGKEFPIVATIAKDEFFYCDWTTSEWIKVVALKWQGGNQVEGFIHKSRIQLIETLDTKRQQEILQAILTKQNTLADEFQKAWKSKDSLAYRTTLRELELHSDIKYSPILDILPKYFCLTKDTILLKLFYAVMWSDKGSANETPSFTIGKCFICNADIVIAQLSKVSNKEQRKLILDNIEWGLLNNFDVDENGKSTNKEFIKLKGKLNSERRRTSS